MAIHILLFIIICSKLAQLGLEESYEVVGFRRPKKPQIAAEVSVSDLGGFLGRKSNVVVGMTSYNNNLLKIAPTWT